MLAGATDFGSGLPLPAAENLHLRCEGRSDTGSVRGVAA